MSPRRAVLRPPACQRWPALAVVVGACVLASASVLGCDRCERPTAGFSFNRREYYVWAWKESGGTLAIGGVVPTSESEAGSLGTKTEATCPPADDAFRFARDPGGDPDVTIACLNTRARTKRPGVDLFECHYQCEYDYCEGHD